MNRILAASILLATLATPAAIAQTVRITSVGLCMDAEGWNDPKSSPAGKRVIGWGCRDRITFATMIDMEINTFLNWGLAASLGVLLLLVVFAIFTAFTWLLGVGRLTGEG